MSALLIIDSVGHDVEKLKSIIRIAENRLYEKSRSTATTVEITPAYNALI